MNQEKNMNIVFDKITAYAVTIPMVKPFRISVGEITSKEFVVFQGQANGVTGWGEAAVDGIPFYASETVGTVLHIAANVFIPLLKSRPWSSPEEIIQAMDIYRGHSFAKAALETMFWDIYGILYGKSVASLLNQGKDFRAWVETGPSIGIKENPAMLIKAIEAELAKGYRRIKIKVCPGKDTAFISAVRKYFPDITLMVDANSAYSPDDFNTIKKWDQYNLCMIEQPLDHDDLYFHSLLCRAIETPVCLDESIITPHIARCAMEMKAADIVNIKVCRVGGLVHAREIHDICAKAGVPAWIGSRLGSGIAESYRLAAASLHNATYPTDATAGLPYMSDDLIESPFESKNGCEVKVPDGPGLGIRVNYAKLKKYSIAKHDF